MVELFWLAQAVGGIGLIFSILSFNSKTRNGLLAHQSSGSFVYFIHYLMLGGWTGAAMELLVVLRNWVFIKKETHTWAKHDGWMYFFILLALVLLAISWQGYISLLPTIGIISGIYTRWHHPPAKIRLYSLGGLILWIPYNIFIHSIAGTITVLITSVVIIVAILKHDRNTPAPVGL